MCDVPQALSVQSFRSRFLLIRNRVAVEVLYVQDSAIEERGNCSTDFHAGARK